MSRTYFFWDPLSDNILQERDESGTVTAEYTTEPGLYSNLISQNRGGVEHQYHFDPQGSTLALTDDNQQVTDTYAYSAFGQETEQVGSTIAPFRYVGRKQYLRRIATNEILVRRRTLSLLNGRWLSVDPLIVVRGRGRYFVYCRNTVTSRIDPSGLVGFSIDVFESGSPTDCGKDIFGGVLFKFSFDEAGTPCDGYFVQMIEVVEQVQDKCAECMPCPADTPKKFPKGGKVFWEAWEVASGHISPIDEENGTYKYTDARGRKIENGCGYKMSKGTVKYFCKKSPDGPETGETGTIDWPKRNPETESGPIPSTTDKPIFWDKKPADGPLTNLVATLWCCCENAELCPGKKRSSKSASSPAERKK